MYKSVVTVKGQIVIPARLRKKFNITHGTKVIFCERNGKITIKPITDDYLRGMAGMTGTKGNLLICYQKLRRYANG